MFLSTIWHIYCVKWASKDFPKTFCDASLHICSCVGRPARSGSACECFTVLFCVFVCTCSERQHGTYGHTSQIVSKTSQWWLTSVAVIIFTSYTTAAVNHGTRNMRSQTDADRLMDMKCTFSDWLFVFLTHVVFSVCVKLQYVLKNKLNLKYCSKQNAFTEEFG